MSDEELDVFSNLNKFLNGKITLKFKEIGILAEMSTVKIFKLFFFTLIFF